MNVPQLRFDGFDGEWESSTLGEISTVQTGPFGSQLHNADYVKEGTPIITVEHFGDNRIIHKNLPLVSDTDRIRLKKYSLGLGDIVFSRVGSIDRRVIVRKEEVGWLFSGRCLRVRVKSKNTNEKYLSHYLGTKKCLNEIQSKAVGGTMASLNTAILSSINICVPALEEQEKVARFFDLLQLKIEKQKEKIGNLEQFKKGMMQKIFSQELRFRDKDVEEFGEWESCKLSELADVRDGTHDTPKYVPTGYPLVTSKNLKKNGNINWENISYISEFDYNEINKRSNVEIGDILFGMIGTIGNPVRVKTSDFAIKNVALIKETGSLLNQYLIHYLKSSNLDKQFHTQQAGGTQKFIGLGQIRNLEISVPINNEQLKISSYLDALTRKVDLENEKLIALEEQKKGFMQEMFV